MTKIHDDIPKVDLYTSYFTSESKPRQEELDSCLRKNLDNTRFREITLFVKDEHMYRVEKFAPGQAMLKLEPMEGIPSYADWLRAAAKKEGVSIFANSDIYFGDDIHKVHECLATPKSVVCLSRHEESEGIITPHKNPKWSQDAWAIDSRSIRLIDFMEGLEIRTGLCRCDNKFLYHFAINGWDVFNPMSSILCVHRHASGVRNYRRTDHDIIGALAFAHPSGLREPSKIEIEIMTLKNENIVGCRINDFLHERKTN